MQIMFLEKQASEVEDGFFPKEFVMESGPQFHLRQSDIFIELVDVFLSL